MDIITHSILSVDDLMDFYEGHAWSGAKDHVSAAIEKDIFKDVCAYIWDIVQDVDAITDTELNDILWFDEVVNNMIYNEEED